MQVAFHLHFRLEIEIPFVFEKFIACVAEAFVNFGVVFFRGETDRFPYFLDFDQLFRGFVPLLAGDRRSGDQFLGLDAKLGFQVEVFLLFLFQLVEMFLMPFVDFRTGFAETVPQLFLVFVGHRAYFAPLFVQLL